MNAFAYLQVAFAVAEAIMNAAVQFSEGQTVNIPGILTYLGGKHVSIDISIVPMPSVPPAA
jgi:hypothetical protein